MNGKVIAICISPIAGFAMQSVQEAEAIAGLGLKGDRYAEGKGSFNKNKVGKRQVTLINGIFFKDSGFDHTDSRRNIITEGVELLYLIDREFFIGEVRLRGVKYCDPCERPAMLSKKELSFKKAFLDRGCIIAEILIGGFMRVNDDVISPSKGY